MELEKISFYSKKRNKREQLAAIRKRRRIEKLEKCYKENPLPKPYVPRITDPCAYRKTFYRQNDAFQFAKSFRSEDLHVFAFESSCKPFLSGERMYMVSSYQHFYHYYSQLVPQKRLHYEIIPDAAVCKLYFDLEYKTAYNIRDGPSLVGIFIQVVKYYLKSLYNVDVPEHKLLQLDATISTKFSRHLIYPNVIFKDNIHAGNFVRFICDEVNDRIISGDKSDLGGVRPESLKLLILKDKNGQDTHLCDRAVYTKNRNFRLYLSRKAGQQNPLVRVAGERCAAVSEEEHFLNLLVANVRYDPSLKILTYEKCHTGSLSTSSLQKHDKNSYHDEECIDGYSQSPYPEVDQYIITRLYKDKVQGQIRRWYYFPHGEQLVFEITKYRWCGRIQRHHKSNNVIFVADLHEGVYYQKCHDPDCRISNYRSADFELPSHVLPKYYFGVEEEAAQLEEDDIEMNDEDLLEITLKTETLYSNQTEHLSSNGFQSLAVKDVGDLYDDDDDDLLNAVVDMESSMCEISETEDMFSTGSNYSSKTHDVLSDSTTSNKEITGASQLEEPVIFHSNYVSNEDVLYSCTESVAPKLESDFKISIDDKLASTDTSIVFEPPCDNIMVSSSGSDVKGVDTKHPDVDRLESPITNGVSLVTVGCMTTGATYTYDAVSGCKVDF